MAAKILTVETAEQKAMIESILMPEIVEGFWKKSRPAGHAESWTGVKVKVGKKLGPAGFKMPRNYNCVNPEFYLKNEDKLLEVSKTVNPKITKKIMKKQLIAISQIFGGRLLVAGTQPTKIARCKNTRAVNAKPLNLPQVKRVPVIFAETESN